jgi:hypothetical protein
LWSNLELGPPKILLGLVKERKKERKKKKKKKNPIHLKIEFQETAGLHKSKTPFLFVVLDSKISEFFHENQIRLPTQKLQK